MRGACHVLGAPHDAPLKQARPHPGGRKLGRPSELHPSEAWARGCGCAGCEDDIAGGAHLWPHVTEVALLPTAHSARTRLLQEAPCAFRHRILASSSSGCESCNGPHF